MGRRQVREPSPRRLRVGEEVRHALAQILERGEIRDPELKDASVTVTEVRMSPDLRNATVFVLPLGGRRTREVVAALRRASPFLRRRVGGTVRLKYVPELDVRADRSFDEAEHIETLLREAEVARDLSDAARTENGDADHGA